MKADDFVYPIVKGKLPSGDYISQQGEGLTIRDHIAIQAMQAEITGLRLDSDKFGLMVAMAEAEGDVAITDIIAREAYAMADAMIAQSQVKE